MRRLPKYVQFERSRHGKPLYYFRNGNGARIRLPDDPKSAVFREAVKTAAVSGLSVYQPVRRPSFDQKRRREVGLTIERIIKGARGRAKARCLPFDIEAAWVYALAEEQEFRCKLTAIPFYMESSVNRKIDPYSPSLDRIDCSLGYTRANTRLVIYAINIMLSDWGEEVFARVANGYRHRRQNKNLYALTFIKRKGSNENTSELSIA
jgi:hypothetical protein